MLVSREVVVISPISPERLGYQLSNVVRFSASFQGLGGLAPSFLARVSRLSLVLHNLTFF